MNKVQEALSLLKHNINSPEIDNYAAEKLTSLQLLSTANRIIHNYEAAFRWSDSAQELENNLRDVEVRKEVADLEAKYQTEKKEQQIKLLTAENEIINQRISLAWLLIGLLFLLVILIIALLNFRRKQAAYRQSDLQQKLLRTQMNPHFIFNVMGSVQGYLYENESDKAAEYLSRFAALSRSILNFSTKESIPLSEEIAMLKHYIELERAGMESPFELEFKIDENIETEFVAIPPMLLQPFIENAIKHGLYKLDYPGKLSIRFSETNEYIKVEIEDNGHGLVEKGDSKHQSKAIDIFLQRKKGIERKFKKELKFEFQNLHSIDQTKQGVRVCFRLPIMNNDQSSNN